MEQNKPNLINSKELETKSYKEIVKIEKQLMNNTNATHADLAIITAERVKRELEMGSFKGYTMDEVFGELLKGSIFEKKYKNRLSSKIRFSTNL